jgi:hypothetical protein
MTLLRVLTSRNTLDTTTTCKTTDSGLGDTLDVVAKDLAVTLSTTLSETLATLSTYVIVSALLTRQLLKVRHDGKKRNTYVQSL